MSQSYKTQSRRVDDSSHATALDRVQAAAHRKALSRSRRRRQFGLRTLLVALAVFAVLFAFAPSQFYSLYQKYRNVTNADIKEKTLERLQKQRPVASEYRNERLVWSELRGYTLLGEGLVNGTWEEYWVNGFPLKKPKPVTQKP